MAALLAALLCPAAAASASPRDVDIEVLSNRADLVSGGDALVAVDLPARVGPADVRVTVGGRDVTRAFAVRPGGRYGGLVTGLANGKNVLTARLRDGRGARLAITNHPAGGPVFAGRQVEPWICATEAAGLGRATDAQCNAPSKLEYVYRSTDTARPGFHPYDPQHPPADVATTTTDQGVTVPYVVRVETTTMDRGITKTAVLADPSRPWDPWAPQKSWNGKLTVPFGGGCAAHHAQTPPAGAYAAGVLDDTALSRGFAVTESGLNTLGKNCNEVVSAEVLMMQKERVAETLGPIRYTIGQGCSGGSIQQYNIAAAYPGLLDGIVPACSFADMWTTGTEVMDCGLLTRYFNQTSPHLWAAGTQRAVVEGHANVGSSCAAWTALFLPAFDPTGDGPLGTGTVAVDNGCGLPAGQRYSRATREGARCDVASYQQGIFGRRPADGFGRRPLDNVGVQYGLGAVNSGQITPGQFVDLNTRIGGYDIDLVPQPERTEADPGSVATAYRSGRVTDARQLADVPILDLRPHNNEEIHQTYYSYTVRARLDRANGSHANQVIWTAPATATTVPTWTGMADDPIIPASFLVMDEWLARIEADRSNRPRAEKVVANRPAAAVDSCWIGNRQVTDVGTCGTVYPHYANPRIAAGGPEANDVLKCRLEPLDRRDYRVTFSEAEWTALRHAFPAGVCDWSTAGVDQRAAEPWTSFAAGPGGRPVGPAPRSTPLPKAASRSRAPRCVGGRRIALRVPRGRRARSAQVFVNGRRVRVVRGRRLTAPVVLRGLPRGVVRVRVVVRLRDGRRVATARRYRICRSPATRRASTRRGG